MCTGRIWDQIRISTQGRRKQMSTWYLKCTFVCCCLLCAFRAQMHLYSYYQCHNRNVISTCVFSHTLHCERCILNQNSTFIHTQTPFAALPWSAGINESSQGLYRCVWICDSSCWQSWVTFTYTWSCQRSLTHTHTHTHTITQRRLAVPSFVSWWELCERCVVIFNQSVSRMSIVYSHFPVRALQWYW